MSESGTKLHDEEEELTTADVAASSTSGQPQAGTAGAPDAASNWSRPATQPGQPLGPGEAWQGEQAPQPEAPEQASGAEGQPAAGPPRAGDQSAPLFAEQEMQQFRSHWSSIQTAFVDNPQEAVRNADHLVAETMKRLADSFARERQQLEEQWSRGGNLSTEDLRVALQRYRSFFDRLLSA